MSISSRVDIKEHFDFDCQGGDVCVDTNYGISKTCCSPYNCVSVTSRTSICTASELQAGEACYSNGVVSTPAT